MQDKKIAGKRFAELVNILDVLRGDQGCPWDRKQDEKSIVDYFLEEVYEAVDALYSGSDKALKEELGDVMMEVVFLARIYKEKGLFQISDVIKTINNKMIRRHPHVFGEKKIENSDQVEKEWNRQKKAEKKEDSVFENKVKQIPALLESFFIGKRASNYGFDWEKLENVMKKLKEELKEMENAVESKEKDRIFEEIGDLLFAVSNVSRHLKINPELALKRANQKFIKRFQFIEKKLKEKGMDLEKASLEDMDALWNQSKEK
ncbi:MAG TPA: nucleoside triphosphate pyrophosphohydrolase [Acidobacteriota bacterium]|nr:nucleoside triphosphate pyrophosphohydrolase [Acidobacteriota bacterium]